MSSASDLHAYLAQNFPSLSGEGGGTRVENLGRYTARMFARGARVMQQEGIEVPQSLFQRLAPLAHHASTAPGEGARFLQQIYLGYLNAQRTPQFLALVRAIGLHAQRHASQPQLAAPTLEESVDDSGEETSNLASRAFAVVGYEVLEPIGAGNMGRVYKARQLSLDRLVALKVLHEGLADEDATYVERFELEAQAAAKLQHPNLVGVIDRGTTLDGKRPYIAFEYVDGETASQLLDAAGGKLPEREALSICHAVAEALVCAEQHEIVHRDVKPDNVLVGRDGIPKLADLGLAKRRTEGKEITSAGLIVGTPHYMAPEQALGVETVDIRADLYALGIMLFHLLSGTFPFDADNAVGVLTRHVNEDVPDVRNFVAPVSPGTARLIEELCRREPNARYPTAAAAVVDFQRALAGKAPLGPARAQQSLSSTPGRVRLGGVSTRLLTSEVPLAEVEPPAERGFGAGRWWAFQHTGNPRYLQEILSTLPGQDSASDFAARALVAFELGRDEEGRAALARAQGLSVAEPLTYAALARSEREAREVSKYPRLLRQLAPLCAVDRLADAGDLAAELRKQYPREAHPHLVRAWIAHVEGDEPGFCEALQLAWALFPSEHSALPLGRGLDRKLARVLIDYGRKALDEGDAERRLQTVEQTDDRGNLVAGSLQLGIGVAHAALGELKLAQESRVALQLLVLRGLTGLQYFAQGLELIARLRKEELADSQVLATLDAEERAIAGYKGAATQPGIRPQRGRYACPITARLSQEAKERLKVLGEHRASLSQELTRLTQALEQRLTEDEAVKVALRLWAPGDDPYAALLEVQAELAKTQEQLRQVTQSPSAPAEQPGGGWLMSRLKGAADMASRAASLAQLKLIESNLRTRQLKEVKALGQWALEALCEDPPPELRDELARAGRLRALLAHREREEQAQLEVLQRIH
ncbi:MAG: serine/threonine-protein kinase [Planctomycetota bacterium]